MPGIAYAAAAWRGFASPVECNSIKIFLTKVKRLGISTEDNSIVDVLDSVDYNLFKKSQFSNHCLERLLPDVAQYGPTFQRA